MVLEQIDELLLEATLAIDCVEVGAECRHMLLHRRKIRSKTDRDAVAVPRLTTPLVQQVTHKHLCRNPASHITHFHGGPVAVKSQFAGIL